MLLSQTAWGERGVPVLFSALLLPFPYCVKPVSFLQRDSPRAHIFVMPTVVMCSAYSNHAFDLGHAPKHECGLNLCCLKMFQFQQTRLEEDASPMWWCHTRIIRRPGAAMSLDCFQISCFCLAVQGSTYPLKSTSKVSLRS